MNEKLKEAMIESFGTQIEPHVEEIYNRLCMSIAAYMYAGNLGDNPLCKLNRIFDQDRP